MDLNKLTAISPVDGRYRDTSSSLAPYFSEYGLIKYRIRVEVEYFIALCELGLPQLKGFPREAYGELRKLYENYTPEEANEVKTEEKITNHDVKAVEYWIKKQFRNQGWDEFLEFIHFGLTSQDINNTAIPLSIKDSVQNELWPIWEEIGQDLEHYAMLWKEVPMLARTHGQPASPTTIGKEIEVFAVRLKNQLELLEAVPYSAKFGGATGNMNAHYAAYPDIPWHDFARDFVEKNLKLKRSFPTTQIEHYDNLAALFDGIKRINTILIDLCRDIWQYISINYFTQKVNPQEVGSSAMPHKVNPIDFENAEGNLGIANALYEHLSAKLPISRMQRDLTDSTVLRNVGVAFAHTLIALRSLNKGLNKIELNKESLDADLENNWAVVSEGIQNILRREGYPQPYEALKQLTRGNQEITHERITEFIEQLKVSDEIKKELMKLSPRTYIGKLD